MANAFELVPDEQNRLTLRRPGEEDVKDVRVRRSFPWSNPGRHVSVRSAEGKELVLIDDPAALESGQRKLIEEHLSAATFIPTITGVEKVDVRFGFQQWDVRTNRGPASFRVQEREDIRFHGDGRFSIRDADGNVYELPPLGELDAHSRKAVEAII